MRHRAIFDLRSRRPIDKDTLVRMNESQHHRGPDGDGFHFEPGVGLGHRRLSIIDLEGGKQPLYNEDHSVVVTFNGEIFNFMEIDADLVKRGHAFRTRCDTEVIVHAWEEWGDECLKRFNGMFAFAVWDRRTKTLFIARDRLGVKPLYYAELRTGTWSSARSSRHCSRCRTCSAASTRSPWRTTWPSGYVPDPARSSIAREEARPGATS